MMSAEFKLRVTMFNERKRLEELGDPRVVIRNSSAEIRTEIDFWCDGDEKEFERVEKLTRKYRMARNKLFQMCPV